MSEQVEVFWEGSLAATHSYALTNREYCAALLDTGLVDLTTVPYEPPSTEPDARLQRLASYDLRGKPDVLLAPKTRPAIWVRHQFPPLDRRPPRGAKWVVMLPWEMSAMPEAYAAPLRHADEVWTASNYGRHALIASGIAADKVFVVPNGVDTAVFSAQGARFPLPDDGRFTFLYVGASIFRKGVDVLLDAYTRAFRQHDKVRLVIKDTAAPVWYQGQTSEALIRSYATRPDSPEMLYLTDYLSTAQLATLYRACNVFVSPYRGEGFSLPTLEAMACGLPVIVTAGGSTDDFVDERIGWKIRAGRHSVGTMAFGQPLPAEGFMLEPDREHLIALLREVYEARGQVTQKGAQAALQAQAWTWQHAIRQMFGRIDALSGTHLQAQLNTPPNHNASNIDHR